MTGDDLAPAPPVAGQTGLPLWRRRVFWGYALLVALGLAAPWLVYPVFAMNVLCLALFASAFSRTFSGTSPRPAKAASAAPQP